MTDEQNALPERTGPEADVPVDALTPPTRPRPTARAWQARRHVPQVSLAPDEFGTKHPSFKQQA